MPIRILRKAQTRRKCRTDWLAIELGSERLRRWGREDLEKEVRWKGKIREEKVTVSLFLVGLGH